MSLIRIHTVQHTHKSIVVLKLHHWADWISGPEVIKHFSCSTQLSTKFINRIRTTSECFEQEKSFFSVFYFLWAVEISSSAEFIIIIMGFWLTCRCRSIFHIRLGCVVQSVTCLATDTCLIADPGVVSLIPARSHTLVEIDHEIISMVIHLPTTESFKKGCS